MRIHILPEKDARRIAAGEVIERPAAALRELLDNAIDAHSTKIQVTVEEGGLKTLEVVDNGLGMDKDDLALSILVHATSKIRCLEDLDNSYTLGFRGEALASLTACSRLTVISRPHDQDIGYALHASLSGEMDIYPTPCDYGTKVCVEQIFYNLPARKRFLKSAGYEQKECLQVFFEKALAHPHIQFQYTVDGQLKHHLTETDLSGRTKQIFGHVLAHTPLFLHSQGSLEIEGFTLSIVAGTPENYYHNRRNIHIYANGRRIEEYSLVQAVGYAYDAVLPGGQFPVAFLFLKIRADLIDFNIHPAKREAKIRTLPAIHKAIVHLLQAEIQPSHNRLQHISQTHIPLGPSMHPLALGLPLDSNSPPMPDYDKEEIGSKTNSPSQIQNHSFPQSSSKELATPPQPWVYLGQAMGVFLIVERNKTLLLIDQHAAHERILFDELCQHPPKSQYLLNPIVLDLTADEIDFIISQEEQLRAYGILISPTEQSNSIQITACPPQMNSEFWQSIVKGEMRNLKKDLYANLACKQAIKEGQILDQVTAVHLIEQTLNLPEPFCPHGRPLWIELGEDQLYSWIKRIV